MIIPMVAEYGEHASIKFICRYPHRRNGDVMIYKKLSINDDRTLQNVLNIPSRHPDHHHVEIYVVKEEGSTMNTSGSHAAVSWADVHTYGELLSGRGDLSTLGSFIQMFALGQSSRSTLAEEAPGQRMCNLFSQGECIEAGGASGSVDPVERLVALGETGDNIMNMRMFYNVTPEFAKGMVFKDKDAVIRAYFGKEAASILDSSAAFFDRSYPGWKIASIVENIKNHSGFAVSYKKAWLGRTKAIAMVFGDWDLSYEKLPKFMRTLELRNPGTAVILETLDLGMMGVRALDRIFWAFRPCIEGFKYCPPVIGIDGTFLYGRYIGVMLIAMAKTVTNNIFPLAFALVESENYCDWSWFIHNIRHLIVPGMEGVTLISDRHAAIISAVKHEWETTRLGQPIGIHRYCLRHFRSNYQKKFGNVKVKDLIWKAGTAHQVRKFDEAMDEIKKLGTNSESAARAYRALCNEDPRKWTLAHDGGYRWGVTTTNDSECYNNVLRGARDLPITSCVEVTFYRLVATFNDKRRQIESALAKGLRYTSKVQAKLEEYQARSAGHHVTICNWASGSAEVVTSAIRPMDNVGSPGPIDGTVLTLQSHHRSTWIWEHGGTDALACRRCGSGLYDGELDPRVLQYVLRAGFYDDVAILLGLPVDGAPITHPQTFVTVQECQDICMQAFGVIPPVEDIDRGRLRMSWLRRTFDVLPEHADMLVYSDMHVLIFFDLLGVYCSQLTLRLWSMCRATKIGQRQIAGALLLLQIWACERFPRMCPYRVDNHTAGQQPLLIGVHFPSGPWGARWRSRFRTTTTSTHVVRVYRDQLDRLRPDEFTWRPYDGIMHELPDYCRVANDIWVSRSPLVYFEVVEWHLPDRVCRQFGLRQVVPVAANTSPALHDIDMRGRARTDWTQFHGEHIDHWHHRREYLIVGVIDAAAMRYDDPYMIWYRHITRTLVGNPAHRPTSGYIEIGSTIKIATRYIAAIHDRIDRAIYAYDRPESLQDMYDARDMCSRSLHGLREHERIGQPGVPEPPPTIPPVVPAASPAMPPAFPVHPPPSTSSSQQFTQKMPKRKENFGASSSHSVPSDETIENQSSAIHVLRTYMDPVGNKWYGRKRCFVNKPILMHDTMGPVSHIFIGKASLRPPTGVTDDKCIRFPWEDLFDKRCEQEMYCRWHGPRVPKAQSATLFGRGSPNSQVIKALEREIDEMQRRLDRYHFTEYAKKEYADPIQ
ncbi:hypothetical protein Acr_17g0009570 [Actinidia rufa]|uniref:Uncharacterized protein n=1 Tax=Actinidia rufa TaxID=165716 RepID=A0A7J0G3M3_9ERIC|nr:hypothetical protein Acr_17g0009570 [Actinidia rufa]